MKNIAHRIGALGFLALLMLGTTTASQAEQNIPPDRQVGEIFVAVGNGQYQVWHPTPPTAVLVETITNGASTDNNAGCAFDSMYHPFTTDITGNDVFKDMIDDPQTSIQTITPPARTTLTQPTSIAFDSAGNFYVGQAGGNGLIEEYGPSGTLVRTLPVGTGKLKGGSAWMDLSTDGKTIYFTNGTDTINQFPVSSSKISKFASISGATLYGLRALTPAAQNATSSLSGGPGFLLVAAVFSGSSNIQLLNASGTTIKTYSVTTPINETNFQVLTLDPNGTSFWAGNSTTENIYRFSLTGNSTDVKVNTGVASSPSGLCAYGGFSAAQLPSITLPSNQVVTQPITVTASLTPSNPQCTVHPLTNTMDCAFSTPEPDLLNGPNNFAITLNGINLAPGHAPNGLQLTYNYSQICGGSNPACAPHAGDSDAGLACDLTSPDGTKCEVHSIDVTPNNGPNGDTSIYQGFDLAITPTQVGINPFVLKNELHDVTDLVMHDPKLGGSDTTKSVFTINEQPIQVTGSQSCGYTSPLLNSQYNKGRTIPFKFQAIAAGGNCSNGPFITTLNARLVLVQLDHLSAGDVPHRVDFSLAGGQSCTETSPCYYRLSTNQWILNVDTSNLQGGGTHYLGTTIDDSHQIPSFSVTSTGQDDIFSVN